MIKKYSRYLPIGTLLMLGLALGAGIASVASADTSRTLLSGQLSLGSSGADVTTLQTFLASNSSIYPEGLVTGYYGPLTEAAVEQFQIGYGLPPVGNVGPLTLARINSLIAAGSGIDVSAPEISGVSATSALGNITITWHTNELSKGTVFYSTTPLVAYETDKTQTAPSISGLAVGESGYTTSHSLVLPGLNAGQNYYYIIESTDVSGNVSVTTMGNIIVK